MNNKLEARISEKLLLRKNEMMGIEPRYSRFSDYASDMSNDDLFRWRDRAENLHELVKYVATLRQLVVEFYNMRTSEIDDVMLHDIDREISRRGL